MQLRHSARRSSSSSASSLLLLASLVLFFLVAVASLKMPAGRSYIDSKASLEKLSDRDMNANLGKEVLLYKDEDLFVYSKPHNVQTSPGFAVKASLASRIAEEYALDDLQRDQLIVHRLDFATSGVILFARNVEALAALHTQFRKKLVYKRYVALVQGIFKESSEGLIDLPLGRDFENIPLNKVNALNGKPSTTQWQVAAHDTSRNVSLVNLRPITGRTHQLRVHLSAIGHPILGDFFYSDNDVYNSARRLCLHAEELRILHPRTNQPMRLLDPYTSQFTLDTF